jgi:hypothetical protein
LGTGSKVDHLKKNDNHTRYCRARASARMVRRSEFPARDARKTDYIEIEIFYSNTGKPAGVSGPPLLLCHTGLRSVR